MDLHGKVGQRMVWLRKSKESNENLLNVAIFFCELEAGNPILLIESNLKIRYMDKPH